ncbi:hypothetical protein FPQ18DRAFT_390396 [Pyronema domesticum]|nr:hypothetical protein FPQ18DRAFT_390396 [Pyronema domesticum]
MHGTVYVLVQEVWNLDTWSFSQILAMNLWTPALLEAIYIFIAKEEYPKDPQYIQEKRQLKRETIERERLEREAMKEHDSDWDEIVIGISDKRQSEI